MYSLEHFIFILPAVIMSLLATLYVQSTFSRYSHQESVSGLPGSEAARRMLASQGVSDVRIEEVNGFLSDHYDPTTRTLRLSPDVYNSSSLSSIGVACHEAGHALQHAAGYAPLTLRTALVPLAQIGSYAPYVLLGLGMLLNSFALVKFGVILFGIAVAFSIVTLPVEWDASARAKRVMVTAGIVSHDEAAMAGKVLNAAFLTYVSAAVMALLNFLFFLLRYGLLGRRND